MGFYLLKVKHKHYANALKYLIENMIELAYNVPNLTMGRYFVTCIKLSENDKKHLKENIGVPYKLEYVCDTKIK